MHRPASIFIIPFLLIVMGQSVEAQAEDSICVSHTLLEEAMSTSTLVTIYATVGFCEAKFPEEELLRNECLVAGIKAIPAGMKEHGLLSQSEIDKAISAGRMEGRKLFHGGEKEVNRLLQRYRSQKSTATQYEGQ